MNQISFFRRAARQVFVLMVLVGLTFAAGIEWAEAATPDMGPAVPGAVHVILLFVCTIGFVIHMLSRAQQQRVHVRARPRARRRAR